MNPLKFIYSSFLTTLPPAPDSVTLTDLKTLEETHRAFHAMFPAEDITDHEIDCIFQYIKLLPQLSKDRLNILHVKGNDVILKTQTPVPAAYYKLRGKHGFIESAIWKVKNYHLLDKTLEKKFPEIPDIVRKAIVNSCIKKYGISELCILPDILSRYESRGDLAPHSLYDLLEFIREQIALARSSRF